MSKINNDKIDYSEALKKVMTSDVYRYRGATGVKRFDGYVWALGWYSSKRLFEEAVDRAYGVIQNSIKK